MAPVTLNNNVNKLTWNVPIVNSDGSPTNEFMRKWAQQGQANASVPDLTTAKAVSAVIDLISSTVGALLVRGATQWTGLVPVADGRVLRDKGVGATPIWDTISDILDTMGSTRGNVLSRGATQWSALAIGGANTILKSTGTDPAWSSLTGLLDTLGAAQGDVLYRDAGAWQALAPGTAGQVLTTGGAAANPSWATPAGGSGGGAASIQDDGTNLYVALSDTDGQLVLDGSGDPIFSKEYLPSSALPPQASYQAELNTVGTGQTFTTPRNPITGALPQRLEIIGKAGGGGGSGAGASGAVAGSDGAVTAWDTASANVQANPGKGGTVSGTGGAGGTSGSGTATYRTAGFAGHPVVGIASTTTQETLAGGDGGGPGAGIGGTFSSSPRNGTAGIAGSGGGGGNHQVDLFATVWADNWGGGGGEAETFFLVVDSPAASYLYSIGDGGAAGTAATGGGNGGKGGKGFLRIKAIW